MFRIKAVLTIALSFSVLAVLSAVQEPPRSMSQTPMQRPAYDIKNETTFRGTVEAVENVAPEGRMGRRMGGRSMSGTHIRLKTESGTLDVHLGPTSFLEEKKLKLEKGDEIEVLGYRMKMGDDDVVLVRQLTRGDETWTLRDANGRPLWRMGRR